MKYVDKNVNRYVVEKKPKQHFEIWITWVVLKSVAQKQTNKTKQKYTQKDVKLDNSF